MDTDEYFLKISEYCNFNVNCINEVLNDRKKLRKILGIESRKELDNVWSELIINLSDYVFRNYKKFPKDEVVQLIATTCGYDFKCMLENLKEYDMKEDMLDYLFDYLKKNYDIEPIINHIIDVYSDEYAGDYSFEPEDLKGAVFSLPEVAYMEFSDRPEIDAFLAMYFDELPCTLCWYFRDMEDDFIRDYEKVFGELPDDVADKVYNKIDDLVDAIQARVEDRFKEIAKSIYDEALNLINNNPEKYKIVGYEDCLSYLCGILDLDKIPLVRVEVEENTQQQEE